MRLRTRLSPPLAVSLITMSIAAASTERLDRLIDQLRDYLRGRLLLCDHADALARHQRAVFGVALDHRTAQRAGPEMLDLQLRRVLGQRAAAEFGDDLALRVGEPLGPLVLQRAH